MPEPGDDRRPATNTVNRIAAGATKLVAGSIAGQAFLVASLPILTRIYTPGDFGVLALYASMLGMLVGLSTLGFDLAIPLPKEPRTAASVFAMAVVGIVVTSILALLVVSFVGSELVSFLNAEPLAAYLWLLPCGVAVAGAYQTASMWSVRRRDFTAIARTKFLQGLTGAAVQILLGLIRSSPSSLIVGHISSQGVGLLTLGRAAVRDVRRTGPFNVASLRAAAARYRRFPLYMMPAILLNTSAVHMVPLLLAAFHGPAVVGAFFLAQRVLGVPTAIVAKAIGDALMGEGAELARDNPAALLGLSTRLAVRVALIVAVPLVAVGIGSEPLFVWALGEGWSSAGRYAQLLAAVVFFEMTLEPAARFALIERQDLSMFWSGGRLVAVVTGLALVGWLGLPAHVAVATYALIMVLSYVAKWILWALVLKEMRRAEAVSS